MRMNPGDWVRWGVGSAPFGDYVMTSYIQEGEGYRINLRSSRVFDGGELRDGEYVVVQIFFDGICDVFEYSLKDLWARTLKSLKEKYGDETFFESWFFFKVENSKLSQWVEIENCGLLTATQFTHYSIVTSAEVIDHLCRFDLKPLITWRIVKDSGEDPSLKLGIAGNPNLDALNP